MYYTPIGEYINEKDKQGDSHRLRIRYTDTHSILRICRYQQLYLTVDSTGALRSDTCLRLHNIARRVDVRGAQAEKGI